MSLETIFGVAFAVFLIISLISRLIPKRMPPAKSFKCGRCGVQEIHDNRTAEAWRNGKTRFFCQSCHRKWLQTQPSQGDRAYTTRGTSGGDSGCFGVVVLFTLVPLGMWAVWTYA